MLALSAVLVGLLLSWLMAKTLDVAGEDRGRWTVAWAFLTITAFLGGHFIVLAAATFLVAAVFARQMRGQVAAAYAVLLPLMPTFNYVIPGVLGINYILRVSYAHVLMIALLMPAFFVLRKSGREPSRRTLDFFFVGYGLWVAILAFVHGVGFTDSARNVVEILLFTLIPYLVISRSIESRQQIHILLVAIVFTGLVQVGVCLFEIAINRNPYLELVYRLKTQPIPGLSYLQQYRFGLLRVRGTIDGGLGLLLVTALSAFLCLGQIQRMARWRVWLGAALLGMIIVFTGSRGVWIMAAMMLCIRIGFPLISTPGRFVSTVAGAMFAIPYAQRLLMRVEDEFGTFDYRARLLDTFFPVVFERPVMGWGDLRFLYGTGRFDHMIQGEGIIDMVNTYLGVALEHGIPGVVLFCGIFLYAVLVALRRLNNASIEEAQADRPVVIWICSIVPSAAFLLVTTSMVGHTWFYITIIVGVASALGTLPRSPGQPLVKDSGGAPGRRTAGRGKFPDPSP